MAAHGFHALRSIGFDPNDRKLLSFLGGNSIECELGSGYASVNVNDYPVGFGKVTDGILKNRLPKGLTVPFYR